MLKKNQQTTQHADYMKIKYSGTVIDKSRETNFYDFAKKHQ